MSCFFVSKRLKIVLSILLAVTGLFGWLTYTWLMKMDEFMTQEVLIEKREMQQELEKVNVKMNAAAEKTVERTKQVTLVSKGKVSFPCMLRMADEEIGIYQMEGRCVKRLKQIGEQLTEVDRQKLSKGIVLLNEVELIAMLESYHLQ